MSTLREQLFLEFSADALSNLTEEFRGKFMSKKGDRFNIQGVTYEIGSPALRGREIEFEISSKIPEDELKRKRDMTEAKYFNAVKAIVRKGRKKPKSIDMDNIVRETREDVRKERDYVKVTYGYRENELFSEKKVNERIKELSKHPEKQNLPDVPGVSTLGGRVVLITLRDNLLEKARENLQLLIDANNQVRKGLKRGK
ncbi:MAG: hypothetical protein V3T44_07670 [bacterium]